MPVDFPNNPVIDDVFTTPNGVVYTWDGVKWVSGPCGVSGGGTPAPPNMAVQWNDNDIFGGSANLVWDNTNVRMGVGTGTPQVRLDVVGNTLLRGETGAGAPSTGSGLFVGYRASFGRGSIYPYNFDTGIYTDLYIESANLFLNFNSSGPVRIPTGTLSLGSVPAGMQPGDLSVVEANSPGQTSGKIFFGNSGANILYNGTSWVFTPALPSGGGGFWQGGSAGAIYYNGGNVGIGTATPQVPLEVTGGSIRVMGQNNPASGVGLELYYNPAGSLGGILAYNRSTSVYSQLDVNDTMFVGGGSGGHVGIGTMSPQAPLHVKSGPNPDSAGQPTGPWEAIIYNASNGPNQNGLLVKNNWAASSSTVFEVGLDGVGGNYNSYFKVTGDAITHANVVSINGAGQTQQLSVNGAIGCQQFASFGGDQTSQVNGSAWYGIGAPNNLANAIQVAGWGGITFVTSGNSSGSQLICNANGCVGVGTASPRTYLTVIPTNGNPGNWDQLPLCIGENSNNGAYGMYLGYYRAGSSGGTIQVITGGAGNTLELNPWGGDVNMPASNCNIAGQLNVSNRINVWNWLIVNSGGIQFQDGTQQSTAAVSSVGGPTTWSGDIAPSRPANTQFVNSTGKMLYVSATISGANFAINVYVAGQLIIASNFNTTGTVFFMVPAGQAYQVNGPTTYHWAEWW